MAAAPSDSLGPRPNGNATSLSKPTILVAEKLGAAGLDLLKEFAHVDCSYNMSPQELCAKVALCDALIVRSGTKVPPYSLSLSLSLLFLNFFTSNTCSRYCQVHMSVTRWVPPKSHHYSMNLDFNSTRDHPCRPKNFIFFYCAPLC
jgi:hypothetical protein